MWNLFTTLAVALAIAQSSQEPPASLLEQARQLIHERDIPQAKKVLARALSVPSDHFAAYGHLVRLAIEVQDREELSMLFDSHRAFPFEDPALFRSRIQHYEMGGLRRAYNQAIQDAIARRWPEAEHGFSLLLGDQAFHHQALGWLFQLAMQQRNPKKAQFISGLAHQRFENPATSGDLMSACALQRMDHQQPALGHLIRELARRGAYAGSVKVRVSAQRAVYVAMIRLHNELDQCFLHGMRNVEEARPLFPDLPDQVLSYLARR
jgi:hypothetical protein